MMTANVTTTEKFNAAVNVIRNLPKNGPFQPADSMKLLFYSYYKQATEGPCNEPKPAFWEVVKKAKWDAWMRLGHMTKEDAMNNYIDELKKIVDTMSYTEDVATFVDKLGPFYDMIDVALPTNKDKHSDVTKFSLNGDLSNDLQENVLANGVMVKKEKSFSNNVDSSNHTGDGVVNREVISERFYSGTESDDDEEFSDPIQNDADKNLCRIEIAALKSNGFPESGEDSVIESNDCLTGIGRNGDVAGVPVDGVSHRGGGDPMASSSTTRNIKGPGRNPVAHRERAFAGGGMVYVPPSSGHTFSAGSGGGHKRGPGAGCDSSDVNEQIAETLYKLQRDMESVLTRLSTLEALTVASHSITRGRMVSEMAPELMPSSFVSWWPFRNMSFKTVAVFFAWPVILQLIFYFFFLRKTLRAARHCRRN